MLPSRAKFLLDAAGLLFSAMAIVFLFLIWRLASGPVRLDGLQAVVESQIQKHTGVAASFAHLAVGANDYRGPFVVHASGVAASLPGGAGTASLDELILKLSLRDLVHGRIRPISLTVSHPIVLLKARQPLSGTTPSKTEAQEDPVGAILKPSPTSPLNAWRSASISNGEIVMVDRAGQTIVTLTGIEGQLKRLATGASLGLSGTVAGQGGNGLMSVTAQYDEGGRGTVQFHSDALPINMLSTVSAATAALAAVQVPVSVTGSGTFQGLSPLDLRLTMNFGPGTIVDPQRIPATLLVKGGSLTASYNHGARTARVDDLHLAFEGFDLAGSGVATTGDRLRLSSDVLVRGLHVDDLGNYWPIDAAPGGRSWVTQNLEKGLVDEATLHLKASAAADTPDALGIDSVTGTMKVSGVTTHYFKKLPPVQQTAADIDYDMKSMTLHLLGGNAAGLAVTGGTIRIDGFDRPEQVMNIDIGLNGPVASYLTILDADPLHYARKLGLAVSAVKGSGDTLFHMDFPLKHDLQTSEINLHTESTLHEAGLPKIVRGLDLTSLNGRLLVGQGGLTVSGRGKIGGIPLDLTWNQDFDRKARLQSEALISGDLTNAQRQILGIDAPDRLTGPIGVRGHYQDFGSTAQFAVAANLKRSDLRIDEIGYDKPPGAAGEASLVLELTHGVLHRISDIDVEAPDFTVKGFAELTPDGKLARLRIDPLQLAKTNVSVDINEKPDGSRIAIKGDTVDVTSLLHKPKDAARQKAPTATTADNAPPLEIDADIGWVQTSASDGLRNFKGQVLLADHRWRHAEFSADVKGHGLAASYLPDDGPNPGYSLVMQAEDLGAVLSALGQTNSIHGGELQVNGRREPATDDTPFPPLTGSVTLGHFKVANPPVFALLFNLLSVHGFMDTLKGDADIQFDRFTGRYAQEGDAIRIADGKLEGAAIGLTIEGSVNRQSNKIDLRGVAVPAYDVNTFLNNVPLLGKLFTGGDGEGVFSTTYSITGTVDKPSVFVNPASIFAPGILRTLFFELPFERHQEDIPVN